MAVVKDWIVEAAEELASHFAFGSWRDDYVPDEQHTFITRTYAAIISRHLPFKEGIAYMPVPRCSSCKHWDLDDADGSYGACLLSGLGSQVHGDSEDCVKTLPDFGCVQWKAKD